MMHRLATIHNITDDDDGWWFVLRLCAPFNT